MPFTDTCQGVDYWSDDLPSQTRLFVCHDYKAAERDHYAWETTVEDERLRNVHVPGGERRRVRGHVRKTGHRIVSTQPAAAVHSSQHPSGAAACSRIQWRALPEGADSSGDMSQRIASAQARKPT